MDKFIKLILNSDGKSYLFKAYHDEVSTYLSKGWVFFSDKDKWNYLKCKSRIPSYKRMYVRELPTTSCFMTTVKYALLPIKFSSKLFAMPFKSLGKKIRWRLLKNKAIKQIKNRQHEIECDNVLDTELIVNDLDNTKRYMI